MSRSPQPEVEEVAGIRGGTSGQDFPIDCVEAMTKVMLLSKGFS